MGLFNHSRAVSANGEVTPAFMTEKGQKRAGWGKQSIILTIATGALFLAIIAAVGSMVTSYTSHSSSAATPTASAAPAITSAIIPTATPVVSDDSLKSVEDAKPADTIQTCGSTPDEARANGCVFDVMMQLWMPPACFDKLLSDRFLEIGNWTWYADTNAAHIYTLEEMRKGEHDAVYVAQDYHVTHCIYAWEKLVRAMRNGEPLITELISYDHVIHCRHKTLMRVDDGSHIRGVRAPTGYTSCAPYDTWTRHLPPNEHSSTE